MSGRLFGLGVGPGDPELITLKALARLRAAPVVAYPAPEDGASFARAHRRALAVSPAQIEIAIRMPIDGCALSRRSRSMTRAAAAIAAHARRGTRRRGAVPGRSVLLWLVHVSLRPAGRARIRSRSCRACPRSAPAPRRRAGRSPRAPTCSRSFRRCSTTRRSRAGLAVADAAAIIKLGRHFARVRRAARASRASTAARAMSSARASARRARAAARRGRAGERALFLDDPAASPRRGVAMSGDLPAGAAIVVLGPSAAAAGPAHRRALPGARLHAPRGARHRRRRELRRSRAAPRRALCRRARRSSDCAPPGF